MPALGVTGSVALPGMFRSGKVSATLGSRTVLMPKKRQAVIAAEIASRVFTDYKIYKGKSALSLNVIKPTWDEAGAGSVKLARPGSILLEFAPATGKRSYEWGKKLTFALSPTEVGELIEGDTGCEFFHDPLMGSAQQGAVRKKLRVTPQDSGEGYFFSLDVADTKANFNERLSIPVSRGEFAVLRRVLDYLLPHLLGFDAVVDPRLLGASAGAPAAGNGYGSAGYGTQGGGGQAGGGGWHASGGGVNAQPGGSWQRQGGAQPPFTGSGEDFGGLLGQDGRQVW